MHTQYQLLSYQFHDIMPTPECVADLDSYAAGASVVRSAAMTDSGQSLELTDENVEMVLDEIRPYLMAGAAIAFINLCTAYTFPLLFYLFNSNQLLESVQGTRDTSNKRVDESDVLGLPLRLCLCVQTEGMLSWWR